MTPPHAELAAKLQAPSTLFAVWLSWFGLSSLGGLLGSQAFFTRNAGLVQAGLFILGTIWVSCMQWYLRRREAAIQGYIVGRVFLMGLVIPYVASGSVLLLAQVTDDIWMFRVWASGAGVLLGLGTALLMRTYVAPTRQLAWFGVMVGSALLSMLLAAIVHPPVSPFEDPPLRGEQVLSIGLLISIGWGLVPGYWIAQMLSNLPNEQQAQIMERITRPVSVRKRWIERIVLAGGVAAIGVGVYQNRCDNLGSNTRDDRS
jgi:hypothetical protein